MSEPSGPPAGWYPDPDDRASTRYWDGARWTDQRAPSGQWGLPASSTGAPPPVVVAQKTNGFAIASLVLGILWIWWVGSALALVFGYVAKSQIDRSGGVEGGRGLAVAGIVLGWIGVAIAILVFLVLAGS